ncbi:hypothetical protein PpBr36_09018, partial [Pyricularia pennisetigena]
STQRLVQSASSRIRCRSFRPVHLATAQRSLAGLVWSFCVDKMLAQI